MFDHSEEHLDENMVVVQANLDDMNPEFCSYITDLLFEEGANDVYWIPIIMKKGRPGIMLNVLIGELQISKIESIIFNETTTLGIRYVKADCHRLGRNGVDVKTRWGVVSVKIGLYKGEEVQYAPEFNQCEEIAKKFNVPLKTVYNEVRKQYQSTRNDE